jgi:uncharacterized protein (TIGR03067 family)
MKRSILVALVVGLVVGARAPDRGKKGVKELEGTWVVVSFTDNGKENDKARGVQVLIRGKTVKADTKDGELKWTFTADPKKKTIDLTPAVGPNQDETSKGTYSVKGDELKICLAQPGADRPKDLTSKKDSGQTLIVLKRAKAK